MNLYVMHDGIGDVHGRYLQSDGNWTSDPIHARKFSSVADLNSAASTLGLTKYEPVQVDPAMIDDVQERMAREMEERRVMGQVKSMLGEVVGNVAAIANPPRYLPEVVVSLSADPVFFDAVD